MTSGKNKDYHILKTEQKALEINLNEQIYGTFAEIGAGQEVARNFFQVGAAAGTIAKTMSAYDKTYSDAIYGLDPNGRYVCESRLYKMLDHEYALMEERLSSSKPDSTFFVFADTVAAINYTKTIKGQGWLGVRFQVNPGEKPNDLVIHVKMTDHDNRLQQEAIGVLGVNLIYSCFFHQDDPETMVRSLHDGLEDRVNIDLIRLSGPAFEHVDNRLLSLYLVKHGLTEVTIFDENNKSIHASEFLYRKSVMVVRGNFRPPTLVTRDVFKASFEQFCQLENVEEANAFILSEITLDYLKQDSGEIDEEDFIDRAELLGAMGHKVIVSNCSNHQMLISYLADYKIQNLGLVIGVMELLEIINEKYYQNQDGRLLVAFGELFTRNIRIYAYPSQQEGSTDLLFARNLPVPEGIKFLYKHLIDSKQIVEVENYNEDLLHIQPSEILQEIRAGKTGWENKVPSSIANVIKNKGLFGFSKPRMEFEY